MNIIGDLGVWELVGTILTIIMIGIIIFFFRKGIPHDVGADVQAWGEKFAN